jgi:hypothetical protein
MAYRRRPWVVLGVIASPFVLAATTGCFTKPPRPVDTNALRCSCSCDDAGTRTVVIAESIDDAEETGTLPVELNGPDLDIGERIVALRFENVALPPKATIKTAYIQFSADTASNVTTNVTIGAELTPAATPFTTAVHDLSNRLSGLGGEVDWLNVPAWAAGSAQQTPDISAVLQELVNQGGWTSSSPINILIVGGGARAARSFDGTPSRAPALVLTYDASIAAAIPVCSSDVPPGPLDAECALVESTFEGLAESCGYPSACKCTPVDVPDHGDTFYSDVCEATCDPVPVDATCSNFDPYGFADCLQTEPIESCVHFLAATNAEGDSPVCVVSGSPLAFQMFGRRSRCDLTGTSDIQVGDREPEKAPATDGIVEVIGGPCDGGGCKVHPFIDLQMADITFEVKWHSDPTFHDLSASGHGLETAVVDGGEATFGSDGIDGTGNGRRGGGGTMAVSSTNDEPLRIGLDWAAKLCDMNGNLATSVDGEVPDGVCENDNSIACTADSPDCDSVGGVCLLEDVDQEEMTVDVALGGTLANQPPAANAGPDQPSIECTSPAGASFLLDGRGTADPDGDLALVRWRRGSRLGTTVSDDLIAVQSLGLGQTESWFLLALDTNAQTDLDDTETTIVDTTPPVITCNLPATIVPPKAPLTFTATATDVCDTQVTPQGSSFSCYGFTTKGVRYAVSCHITLNGNKIVIRNSGGVGTFIDWNLSAADDSNNTSTAKCTTRIVNPIKG